MVTGVDVVTALVLTVNVALLAPAATVTVTGTVAAAGVAAHKGDDRAAKWELARSASPCRLKEDPPVTLVGSAFSERRE